MLYVWSPVSIFIPNCRSFYPPRPTFFWLPRRAFFSPSFVFFTFPDVLCSSSRVICPSCPTFCPVVRFVLLIHALFVLSIMLFVPYVLPGFYPSCCILFILPVVLPVILIVLSVVRCVFVFPVLASVQPSYSFYFPCWS